MAALFTACAGAQSAPVAVKPPSANKVAGADTSLEPEQVASKSVPPSEPVMGPVVPTMARSAVFLLDGKPFCFQGTNQYYLTWKTEEMIDDVFKNAQSMGVEVLRHWAHLDAGALDGSVPHLSEDGTKQGVYFQYWDPESGKPAYNDGPNGLERLDLLVKKASDANIRLILTLTNNWPDFGGMDQYLLWYGLKNHAEFYSDHRVRQAFKDWITHLLTRVNSITGVVYRDDPTIFAWELANEPRVHNSGRFDQEGGWDRQTITKWADEMSTHIRSVDPAHLISVGDEGHFWNRNAPMYDGADGVDHEALIALKNIDFSTFHLYPEPWKQSFAWSRRWIEDHLVAARAAGKPAVMEEYGVAVMKDPRTREVVEGWERRKTAYGEWNAQVAHRGGAGTMFWLTVGKDEKGGHYPDYDHLAIYDTKSDPSAQLLREVTPVMKQARACTMPSSLVPTRDVPAGFVTTSKP